MKKQLEQFVEALNMNYGSDKRSYDYSLGKKYAKVFMDSWGQRSVWGFVVMNDTLGNRNHPPYKQGDLLKSASWNKPAKWARGNILNDTAKYGEYSPQYIK